MAVFVLRRAFMLLLTLIAASMAIFAVMNLLPGDPAGVILGAQATPETYAALRRQLGLDDPWLLRYVAWMGGMLTGDLGDSYIYREPVATLIGERLPVTVPLALMAMALTVLLALPLGTLAAATRGGPVDFAVMGVAQLGIAAPNFWFGVILAFIFAVKLQWLPSGGFPGWSGGLWPGIKALLLPATALGLTQMAILARVTRSAVLETLGEDYVRTARAKGLSRVAALVRHALRNALIPIVTIMGLQFAVLISGAIIIENVFYLPGLGRLIFQAIGQRDLTTVQSAVVLIAAMVIVVNFLVDLLYAALDPRLRTPTR